MTERQTRFETQEIELIEKLKKLYDLKKLPFIIVNTQCYSNNKFIQLKNFINEKYGKNFLVIGVLARDDGDIKSKGMEELKKETEKKLKNFSNSSYYSKFVANVSKNLYNNYNTNSLKSFLLKGFFKASKEESIDNLFNVLFNMYRFKEKDVEFNNIQKSKISDFRKALLNNYKYNIDDFIDIVVKFNAESEVRYKNRKNNLTEEELNRKISDLYIIKKNNEFNTFKDDIDTLLFPCLLEVLKTEIISFFNKIIMEYLKPEIQKLMAQKNNN